MWNVTTKNTLLQTLDGQTLSSQCHEVIPSENQKELCLLYVKWLINRVFGEMYKIPNGIFLSLCVMSSNPVMINSVVIIVDR